MLHRAPDYHLYVLIECDVKNISQACLESESRRHAAYLQKTPLSLNYKDEIGILDNFVSQYPRVLWAILLLIRILIIGP